MLDYKVYVLQNTENKKFYVGLTKEGSNFLVKASEGKHGAINKLGNPKDLIVRKTINCTSEIAALAIRTQLRDRLKVYEDKMNVIKITSIME